MSSDVRLGCGLSCKLLFVSRDGSETATVESKLTNRVSKRLNVGLMRVPQRRVNSEQLTEEEKRLSGLLGVHLRVEGAHGERVVARCDLAIANREREVARRTRSSTDRNVEKRGGHGKTKSGTLPFLVYAHLSLLWRI